MSLAVALGSGRDLRACHCGLGIGEIDCRHGLACPSRTEAPGDDQSIIASPQTEVPSGHSINDDEHRDEPERRENILDHCRNPKSACWRQCTLSAAIRHNMVEEWLRSEAEALELRFASVVDANRASLFAIGERHEQISEFGVGAMCGDEPLDVVAPVPTHRSQTIVSVRSRMSDRVSEPSRGMAQSLPRASARYGFRPMIPVWGA
jgi:hypothetical protein